MVEADVLRARAAGRLLLVGAFALSVACDSTNVIPIEVTTVEVAPPMDTMLAGESRVFEAIPRGPEGDVLSGRFVTWTSSTPGVATVSSGGDVEARGEGETTITATIEGITASSDLTVLRGPEIRLNPSVVGISAFAGDDDIPPETVAVENASPNGDVEGLEMFIEYVDGGSTGWLASSTLEGTAAPTELTVQANASGMGEGEYTAEIRVHSTTAANSPQSLEVRLNLGQPRPRINLSQTQADFGSVSRRFFSPVSFPPIDVQNTGGGDLTDLDTNIVYETGPDGWLTATLDSSQAPTRLRLSAWVYLRPAGTYEARVEIESDQAINAPQSVFVTITVVP